MLVTFNLDSLTKMTRVTLGHRDWNRDERTPGGGSSHISLDVMPGMFRAQMTGLERVTSKPSGTARTNRAFVRAVAGFAAFVAYRRGLHPRAVASVVALSFERALAIGALVYWTRKPQSAFVGRAAAFAASGLITFGC